MAEQTTEGLVEKYVMLRDAKAAAVARFKEKMAKVDDVMAKFEAQLLNQLEATGAESIRTKAGTAYKSVKTSATVADWDAVLEYAITNGLLNLLEKRVNKTAVLEFKEEHNDLPPGVNLREELVVNVRRS